MPQAGKDTVSSATGPTSGHWSDPVRAVAGEPGKHAPIARFPDLVVGRNETYLLGDDIPAFDEAPLAAPPLYAALFKGVGIGRPPGSFHFVAPRGVIDEAGALHAIWAEPSSAFVPTRAEQWPPAPLTALFVASYSAPTGWTTPHQLVSGTPMFWPAGKIFSGTSGNLLPRRASGDRDDAALVVSTFTGEIDQPLMWFHRQSGSWAMDRIAVPHAGPSASARIVVRGSDIYLALLAPDLTSPEADRNSVFFLRSSDQGRSWSVPTLISRSGRMGASSLNLLVNGDTVHVMWVQPLVTKQENIRHAISMDGGTVWRDLDTAIIDPRTRNLQAVFDSTGRIHVVWEGWHNGPSNVAGKYVTWDGRWSAATAPFHGFRLYNLMLTASADGRPLVVFEGGSVAESTDAPLATFYSELTP